MDDILKRMMAAEAEADEVVKKATEEADALRGEARRQANVLLAEAQKKLAAEADEFINTSLEKARVEEKEALEKGDANMKDELLAFDRRFAARCQEVTDLLLYPEVD